MIPPYEQAIERLRIRTLARDFRPFAAGLPDTSRTMAYLEASARHRLCFFAESIAVAEKGGA